MKEIKNIRKSLITILCVHIIWVGILLLLNVLYEMSVSYVLNIMLAVYDDAFVIITSIIIKTSEIVINSKKKFENATHAWLYWLFSGLLTGIILLVCVDWIDMYGK